VGKRSVEPTLVGDQHAHRDLLWHVDRSEHLARVGELWDHVGPYEARHLDPAQARARERVDQLHLRGGGQDLGLVLKPVARANLPDADRIWQRRWAHVRDPNATSL
jgi:hypothetical protein